MGDFDLNSFVSNIASNYINGVIADATKEKGDCGFFVHVDAFIHIKGTIRLVDVVLYKDIDKEVDKRIDLKFDVGHDQNCRDAHCQRYGIVVTMPDFEAPVNTKGEIALAGTGVSNGPEGKQQHVRIPPYPNQGSADADADEGTWGKTEVDGQTIYFRFNITYQVGIKGFYCVQVKPPTGYVDGKYNPLPAPPPPPPPGGKVKVDIVPKDPPPPPPPPKPKPPTYPHGPLPKYNSVLSNAAVERIFASLEQKVVEKLDPFSGYFAVTYDGRTELYKSGSAKPQSWWALSVPGKVAKGRVRELLDSYSSIELGERAAAITSLPAKDLASLAQSVGIRTKVSGKTRSAREIASLVAIRLNAAAPNTCC